ncbi:YceI family protein [Lentzea sp. CA-135723]|uniref:YceI family protein n=1 Tax=Lentzea sp. CA-135723 TaxID=3239950 RepID=UPI003D8B7381
MMDITFPAGSYVIDAAHSSVTFATRFVAGRVRGTFDDISGTVEIAEDPEKSSVTAQIGTQSLHTGIAPRDAHLSSADYFDVENHPSASFTSTELIADGERFALRGDLTFRGVTQPVEFDLYPLGSGTDHFGSFRVAFHATARVSRKAFGVNGNASLPGGPLLIGDATDVTLEIQAVPAA